MRPQPYKVATVVSSASGGLQAVIQGPGLGPGGLQREFASHFDALAFVDAMNTAFNEGLSEGSRKRGAGNAMGAPPAG